MDNIMVSNPWIPTTH